MKRSRRCYSCIAAQYNVALVSVNTQRRVYWVVKGLDMGKRRLLKEMSCVILSSLNFTANNSVRYFDQAWLSKATDIVGGEKGSLNS